MGAPARRRAEIGQRPTFSVEGCESVRQALKRARQADADCLVLDARGFADAQTLDVAQAADAVLIPSGLAVDDLLPAVRLAHELTRAGVPRGRIGMALCRAGDAEAELAEATRYIAEAGYQCLATAWPERAGYRRAHDSGRVATEARHPSLRAKAEAFAAAAIAFIAKQPTQAAAQAPAKAKEGKHGKPRA